ncbi:MAG: GntR family transcriptional regulator [Bacteroidota bacterium]
MQFRESQAIYLQIAEHVCERVLLKEWEAGARVPSVRELAVQLEVNPNTVMRTYEFLQQQEIITNQRGIGYFIAGDAWQHAVRLRKQTFVEKDLPQMYRSLFLLGMDTTDLKPGFEKYKKQYFLKGKDNSTN